MTGRGDEGATRRVCAWCGEDMGPVEEQDSFLHPVTHGLCDRCNHILVSYEEIPLAQLLERLKGPVLAVDGVSGEVLAANDTAVDALGRRRGELVGRLGGDVTECVHAGEPGGCGRTVHCSGCTLRMLFEEVHRTGRAVAGRPAYQHVVTPAGIMKRHYLISAEKRAGVVLLRIDILPEDSGATDS